MSLWQPQPTNAEVKQILDKLRDRLGPDFDVNEALRAYARNGTTEHCVAEESDDCADDIEAYFDALNEPDDELQF